MAALEYPLTEAQSGLWFAQRLDPANPIFNTAHYLDIRGDLDVEIRGTEGRNELAQLAQALAIFRQNAVEARTMADEARSLKPERVKSSSGSTTVSERPSKLARS